jgi:proline iminopeptidase
MAVRAGERSLRVSINGVVLDASEAGSGVPIVLLHGGPGMSSRASDWRSYAELADTYRVVAYDMRGCGASEGKPPYSHAQWVDDLEQLRKQLGLGQMVLLGGSYGGHIALEYALRHQAHLLALILRDTAASSAYHHLSIERALASGLPMDRAALDRLFGGRIRDDEDFRASYAMIQPLYRVDYDPAQGASELERIPFRYQTHNWAFSRNQPDFNLVPQLSSIRVPTLVTVGRHDWITPVESSLEIAREIPGSRLRIFENSGHSPQIEEHGPYLELVRDFLAEVLPG